MNAFNGIFKSGDQSIPAVDSAVRQLREIPGIGLLTGTALRASVCDIQRFPSGRHFASWLGLTARERSSAESRRLGSISKRGDIYLRTLLVHGARSALLAARRTERIEELAGRIVEQGGRAIAVQTDVGE